MQRKGEDGLGKFEKWILFAVGNFPIYILIFIQNFDFSFFCKIIQWVIDPEYRSRISISEYIRDNTLPIVCLLLLFSSFILFEMFLGGRKTKARFSVKIKSVTPGNENYLGTVNSYILPLLVTNFESLNTTLSFLTVLFLNGYLYSKTELYNSNIFLAMKGYNHFNVEFIRGSIEKPESYKGVLLSKKNIDKNQMAKVIYLNDENSVEMTIMEVGN